jgi:hypothetical protein
MGQPREIGANLAGGNSIDDTRRCRDVNQESLDVLAFSIAATGDAVWATCPAGDELVRIDPGPFRG